MSLAINTDLVTEVLLADGTWYPVAGESFDIDAYEFVSGQGRVRLPGGSVEGIVSTGATWVGRGDQRTYVVPLSAICGLKMGYATLKKGEAE